MSSRPLYVSIVVDVEEEGLFTGRYPRNVTAGNVEALPALAPLTTECGIPLTLVCAHPVFTDPAACRVLSHMRNNFGAEVGAHLHYWSTPPHGPADGAEMQPYVAAKDVDKDLLRAKFTSLFTVAAEFCAAPVTTFRMGRWDMSRDLWPLLEEQGVKVDSSIRPWHYPAAWRDHFMAPLAPYRVEVNGREILEVPDTAVPLFRPRPALTRALRAAPAPLLHKWHQLIVMTPNPVYHSLAYMKAAASLMLARGQKVLSLTWHSSEIMPGATPHLPTRAHVEAMLGRARAFLHWLRQKASVRGVTLGQLGEEGSLAAPQLDAQQLQWPGDWHP